MGFDGFFTAPADLSGQFGESKSTSERRLSQQNSMESFHSVIISLLSEHEKIKTIRLIEATSGRYCFENSEDSRIRSLIGVEIKEGKWKVLCMRPLFFLDHNGKPSYCLDLLRHDLIEVDNLGYKCFLLVQCIYPETLVYHNYVPDRVSALKIGREESSDIVYRNSSIGKHHAELELVKNQWLIREIDHRYGVFVNGKKVEQCVLKPGDHIFILGLHILVGVGFFGVTDGIADVEVSHSKLFRVESTRSMVLPEVSYQESSEEEPFNRRPRRRIGLEKRRISIEAPPMSLNSDRMPLILRMGGSMVMGGTAALAGNYAMLLTSVLFPLLTQKFSSKERKEYEQLRDEKYTEYLENKEKEIKKAKENEERVLNSNYPSLNEMIACSHSKSRVWERKINDDDFLMLRMGSGQVPLKSEIEYPDHKFDLNDDPLEKKMYNLVDHMIQLDNVPIMSSLLDHIVTGVTGPTEIRLQFVQQLLIQAVFLHSYDELKIVVLADACDVEKMEFVKYLPHVWDNQRIVRYVAANQSEAYQVGEFLQREIEKDLIKPRNIKDITKERPYYLLFALDKRLFDSLEVLKDAMKHESSCGVSVIAAFDELPKECTQIIDIQAGGRGSLLYLRELDKEAAFFQLDNLDQKLAEKTMKLLANATTQTQEQSYVLPKMISFLELYGVGRVEHLNPVKRWKDNNPVKSLSAPIGVGTDGAVFELDLHQKYQGPHGLVAGMTGSGKSEFLLTYILSMAVCYNPDEVAFVLIDYKGGGLAGAFSDPVKGVHLPHLVGTITNLDGSTIRRSIMSLQSELVRRQQVFNEVKGMTDEGTMDIYVYQKLFRSGKVSQPMPHLFIISDEFAELKQQQPDFMDQLISIARIGRSLGVHLILATQKPAGVVNDQIRSNTKFRICLKVQDKGDSMDMLKRPEAAELKETGRFYLQVGYNEYFAMGQSAWSGAPYYPGDQVVEERDDSVLILDGVGTVISEAKPEVKKEKESGVQLVEIVKMLSEIAQEQRINPRQLWKPELPKRLGLSALVDRVPEGDNLPVGTVCLGLVDDPERQKQFTLNYDITHGKHLMIVGSAGSGKTTLIQHILYSILSTASPEEVNLYILDYSSRMLKLFGDFPHCGGVLFEENSDVLDSFFEIISEIVEERKKLFSNLEVDSFDAACAIQKLPLILVVIDGYIGLTGSKEGERQAYRLQDYLREGSNYGVKYIVSCSHLNEVGSRIKQELGDRICLHMKDKYDYSEALGCKVDYVPTDMPGRALCNVDGRALEMQAGMVAADAEANDRVKQLKMELDHLKEQFTSDYAVRKLPVISEKATYEEFSSQFQKKRIPLGYSKKNAKPVAFPLKQLSALSIYVGNPAGAVPVMENMLFAGKRERMIQWIIKRKENSLFDGAVRQELFHGARVFECESSVLEETWRELADIMGERRKLLDQYCEEKGLDVTSKQAINYIKDQTQPMMILIENHADFCSSLTPTSELVFDKLLSVASSRNIYPVAFFEPEDYERTSGSLLYMGFNVEANVLLLGGKFNEQKICEISGDSEQISKVFPYNIGLMYYRRDYYPLLMPCGDVVAEAIDEDEQSIF